MVNFLEKRIIAIDDEELNRVIFEGFFSVYNFTNFRIYRTAEEFLRGEPKLGDVDLLITDYFLPGMNGLNLLNFL
ncbi:MAG: response regulator, partial [Candidatus Dojkabacteria bacterium]